MSEHALRYLVTFQTVQGATCRHTVTTWHGELKAVAMASTAHQREHPERHILEVLVQPLGELEVDTNGVYVLRAEDLVDRMEW